MSEHVARRCDDTVDKKRVNSCQLKHLFLEGVEQPKNRPKTWKCSLQRPTDATFSKIAADAAQKKPRFRAVF